MNKKYTSEAYRLRAEELRAIASDMDRPETRRILTSIAEDYERLASSAEFLTECHGRLTAVSEEFERPLAAHSSNGNGSGGNGVRACRTMAADAQRLATEAEGASREAWLKLSERWSRLANSLEQTEADA
jgi:hypothetical protein